MRVIKEQIEKAKEWDLLSYLQAYEPHELKRSGPNEYCTRTHDSLKITREMVLAQPGVRRPHGAGLPDKGQGDGLCGGGGGPVRLPCPAAIRAVQTEASKAVCAARGKPVCHSDGVLPARQGHRPGPDRRVYQGRHSL